uniref:Uncharacterized protein n=1 Tax=Graphocephala atropunctata TaxID=36148 RepID=A0A1B6MJ40_9HEMI
MASKEENYVHPVFISQNGSWKFLESIYVGGNISEVTQISKIVNCHFNKAIQVNLNVNEPFSEVEDIHTKIDKGNESNKSNTTGVDTFHKAFELFVVNYEYMKNNKCVAASQLVPDEETCAFQTGTITTFIFTDCVKQDSEKSIEFFTDRNKLCASIIVDSFQTAFEQFLANYEYNESSIFNQSVTIAGEENTALVDASLELRSFTELDEGSPESKQNLVDPHCRAVTFLNPLYSKDSALDPIEDTVIKNVGEGNQYRDDQSKINCCPEKSVNQTINCTNNIGYEFDSDLSQYPSEDKTQNIKKCEIKFDRINISSILSCKNSNNTRKSDNLLLTQKPNNILSLKYCNSASEKYLEYNSIHRSTKARFKRTKSNLNVKDIKDCKNITTKYSVWDSSKKSMPRRELLRMALEVNLDSDSEL